MKRKKYSIRGALLMFLTVLPTSAMGSTVPLTILNKSLDHEDRVLSFELWNTGDKVINAWRLSLAHDDGSGKSRRSVLDRDFAFVADQTEDLGIESPAIGREGPIRPGAVVESEWTIDLPADGSESEVLSLRVAAAVFEDGTFSGDGEVSKTILAGREARLEQMQSTLEFLRETLADPRRKGRLQEDLVDRARSLRSEGQDVSLAAGLRREVAAQLSAVRLEMAELLEGLGETTRESTETDGGDAVEKAIADLEARVALGRGWVLRRTGPKTTEDAGRVTGEVY